MWPREEELWRGQEQCCRLSVAKSDVKFPPFSITAKTEENGIN